MELFSVAQAGYGPGFRGLLFLWKFSMKKERAFHVFARLEDHRSLMILTGFYRLRTTSVIGSAEITLGCGASVTNGLIEIYHEPGQYGQSEHGVQISGLPYPENFLYRGLKIEVCRRKGSQENMY